MDDCTTGDFLQGHYLEEAGGEAGEPGPSSSTCSRSRDVLQLATEDAVLRGAANPSRAAIVMPTATTTETAVMTSHQLTATVSCHSFLMNSGTKLGRGCHLNFGFNSTCMHG